VASAHVTDLLEHPGEELTAGSDGAPALDLRPFPILTLRLRRT
jgi:alpha-mannosidase